MEQDLKTNGENREAKRRIITTIDCVGLKGYNSILFGPAAKGGLVKALGIDVNASSKSELENSGTIGEVVYLLADSKGFAKGTLVTWNGAAWVEYEGVIEG